MTENYLNEVARQHNYSGTFSLNDRTNRFSQTADVLEAHKEGKVHMAEQNPITLNKPPGGNLKYHSISTCLIKQRRYQCHVFFFAEY